MLRARLTRREIESSAGPAWRYVHIAASWPSFASHCVRARGPTAGPGITPRRERTPHGGHTTASGVGHAVCTFLAPHVFGGPVTAEPNKPRRRAPPRTPLIAPVSRRGTAEQSAPPTMSSARLAATMSVTTSAGRVPGQCPGLPHNVGPPGLSTNNSNTLTAATASRSARRPATASKTTGHNRYQGHTTTPSRTTLNNARPLARIGPMRRTEAAATTTTLAVAANAATLRYFSRS